MARGDKKHGGRLAPVGCPPTPARVQELLNAAARALQQLREAEAAAAGCGSPAHARRVAAEAKDAQNAVDELLRACRSKAAGTNDVPLPPTPTVARSLEALARVIAGALDAPPRPPPPAESLLTTDAPAPTALVLSLHAANALAANSVPRVAALARSSPLVAAVVATLAHDDDAAFAAAADVALLILQEAIWPEMRAAWTSPDSADNLLAITLGVAGAMGRAAALPPPGAERGGAARREDSDALALAYALTDACPPQLGLHRRLLSLDGFGDALCDAVARCAARIPPSPRAGLAGGGGGGGGGGMPPNGALVLAAALAGAELGTTLCAATRGRSVHVHIRSFRYWSPRVPGLLLARAPALPERLADVVAAGRPWFRAAAQEVKRRRRRGGGGGGDNGWGQGRGGRDRDSDSDSDSSGGEGGGDGASGARPPIPEGLMRLNQELFPFALAALNAMAPALGGGRPALVARLAPALLGMARAWGAAAGAWPAALSDVRANDRHLAVLSGVAAAHLLRRLLAAAGAAGAPALAKRAPGAAVGLLRIVALAPLRHVSRAAATVAMAHHFLATDAAHALLLVLGVRAPAAPSDGSDNGLGDGDEGDCCGACGGYDGCGGCGAYSEGAGISEIGAAIAQHQLAEALVVEPALLVRLGGAAGADPSDAMFIQAAREQRQLSFLAALTKRRAAAARVLAVCVAARADFGGSSGSGSSGGSDSGDGDSSWLVPLVT